ncbi:hypothetical protein SAY86_008027 [Trapa natans]|uniref:MATH domain-containing protein n=1 Tax=Trapa natans TaxID=22666 RepID=A0AAN7LIE8_TRANT|nr:hypothetical protein SAY86_008027 [Trapa natans]
MENNHFLLGPKPSELYGKHTWKIEKFSQITKRELRGNVFEVGGYKWYILIYPQGCDVCNHLSLFLCVANHDKLLPGWSHFAQFTIAVVNKDSKKSKYSDTLHRFWKKEHDWGWKKFMELTKLFDGFVNEDTLIIKAQVQVLREKADRPFRCLYSQYRRELLRLYMTNVEQICRRFVEERRGKLEKLIEDRARWTSLRTFWMDIDPDTRRNMSRENTDVILKIVVKHFFIEKEVTSTLVMDSLYSGLKALESHSKCIGKKSDTDVMRASIVCIEQDTFILVDDVLPLLERAALEPLPPKDENGPQNRIKDGNCCDDINKDPVEHDERRLTELGWRTLEIFVLAHIFSYKIEVAYQEAVALKRQEELIREEEAAWHAESEQKTKRGTHTKEKKSKKKQSKQKRNNRKAKERERMDQPEREDEPVRSAQNHMQKVHNPNHDTTEDLPLEQVQLKGEKSELLKVAPDVADLVDSVGESLQFDFEERDAGPINWDTDNSEVLAPTEATSSGASSLSPLDGIMIDKARPSGVDDSSSTCSSDSVPSVVTIGSYKGNSFQISKNQKSPGRGTNQRSKRTNQMCNGNHQGDNSPGSAIADVTEHYNASLVSTVTDVELKAVATSLHHNDEASSQKRPSSINQIEKVSKEKAASGQTTCSGSSENSSPTIQIKLDQENTTPEITSIKNASSSSIPEQIDGTMDLSQVASMKPEVGRGTTPKPPEKPTSSQVAMMPRPSSAPLGTDVRSLPPPFPVAQSTHLASSVSAVGHLGSDPTSAAPSYSPRSYRNAIIGNSFPSSSSAYAHPSSQAKSSGALGSSAHMFLPPNERTNFPFSAMGRDLLPNDMPMQWVENSNSSNDLQNLQYYRSNAPSKAREQFLDLQAGSSGRQAPGLLSDDFPHLDIINDLLDEEHGVGKFGKMSSVLPHSMSRQFTFPGEAGALSTTEASISGATCRFERTRSYHENGSQRVYSTFSRGCDSFPGIPQVSPLPYMTNQMDGMIQNQWNIGSSNLSLLGMKSLERESYPYYSPDYSNLACTGYNVFQPPSSH